MWKGWFEAGLTFSKAFEPQRNAVNSGASVRNAVTVKSLKIIRRIIFGSETSVRPDSSGSLHVCMGDFLFVMVHSGSVWLQVFLLVLSSD